MIIKKIRNLFFRIEMIVRVFAWRNWKGCEYCNKKMAEKVFGEKFHSPEDFNMLLDGYCYGESNHKDNLVCYFYPLYKQIRIYDSKKKDHYLKVFISSCPVCGRSLDKSK